MRILKRRHVDHKSDEETTVVLNSPERFQLHPYAPCMLYLPTFGFLLGQMLVNIPYMEHMGQLNFRIGIIFVKIARLPTVGPKDPTDSTDSLPVPAPPGLPVQTLVVPARPNGRQHVGCGMGVLKWRGTR